MLTIYLREYRDALENDDTELVHRIEQALSFIEIDKDTLNTITEKIKEGRI